MIVSHLLLLFVTIVVSPGGGAVEAALSIYLESFANTLGSREQLAIADFAEALLVIPKTLAVNAAKDATELVAKLRAYHYTAQVGPLSCAENALIYLCAQNIANRSCEQ